MTVFGLVGGVGSVVTLWLVVEAIVQRMRASGAAAKAAPLDVLRWAVNVLQLFGAVAWLGFVELVAVVLICWFVALVALVVLLYAASGPACLAPENRQGAPSVE